MFEPFLARLQALISTHVHPPRNRDLASLGLTSRLAAEEVRTAQAALARAKAGQQQDRNRLTQLDRSIEDLEARARTALRKGVETLAREAAEAIAIQEDERDALRQAVAAFDHDLADLTDQFHRAQSRLRAVKRGERTAEVHEKVQKAKALGSASGPSALSQAEERLSNILGDQERDLLAEREFASLAPAPDTGELIEKHAEAGCGEPVRARADDILERLRAGGPLLLEKSN